MISSETNFQGTRSIQSGILYNVLIIYLFNDNLATGGSLTGAILSCHVEL